MTTQTDTEMMYLRKVFRKYDDDGCGFLNKHQFYNLVTKIGRKIEELHGIDHSVSDDVFAYFDVNSDGKMSFQEFYEWWTSEWRFRLFNGKHYELLRKARELYTKYASSGQMKFTEFEKMMEELNSTHPAESFDAIDTNNNGLISFPEFVTWLKWIK